MDNDFNSNNNGAAGEVATTKAAKKATKRAVFAAGCFWGVEAAFRKIDGVVDARSGYTGGHLDHATYERVCRGDSGHAEAVEVLFDPARVSYSQLLDAFWQMHDPTQVDRQGADVGSQYRSAVFYIGDEQRRIAEQSIAGQQHKHPRPVATQLSPLGDFWAAEDYHQNYAQKRRGWL